MVKATNMKKNKNIGARMVDAKNAANWSTFGIDKNIAGTC